MPTGHVTTRINHISEHRRRPAKNIVFESHSFVDRDVILNLDVVADNATRRDDNILTKIAVFADPRIFHDMTEMPNLGSLSYRARLFDRRRFVHEIRCGVVHMLLCMDAERRDYGSAFPGMLLRDGRITKSQTPLFMPIP